MFSSPNNEGVSSSSSSSSSNSSADSKASVISDDMKDFMRAAGRKKKKSGGSVSDSKERKGAPAANEAKPKFRVLLAEDFLPNAKLVMNQLRKVTVYLNGVPCEWEFIHKRYGQEVLDFDLKDCQLLVLDCHMKPEEGSPYENISGLSVAKQVREDKDGRYQYPIQRPIFLYTSVSTDQKETTNYAIEQAEIQDLIENNSIQYQMDKVAAKNTPPQLVKALTDHVKTFGYSFAVRQMRAQTIDARPEAPKQKPSPGQSSGEEEVWELGKKNNGGVIKSIIQNRQPSPPGVIPPPKKQISPGFLQPHSSPTGIPIAPLIEFGAAIKRTGSTDDTFFQVKQSPTGLPQKSPEKPKASSSSRKVVKKTTSRTRSIHNPDSTATDTTNQAYLAELWQKRRGGEGGNFTETQDQEPVSPRSPTTEAVRQNLLELERASFSSPPASASPRVAKNVSFSLPSSSTSSQGLFSASAPSTESKQADQKVEASRAPNPTGHAIQ